MLSLNHFLPVRRALVALKRTLYVRVFGMSLHPSVQFSLSAYFDRTYPKGVHVGAETWVAFGATILTHDRTRGLYLDTVVGERCFIGARSVVLPGVRIGDESIVAAGAVVTKDVPPRSIVAGNPATVIREGIEVGPYGRFVDADANTLRLKAEGRIR
jgi:acetyltransferase-like isoleucine patch superfamily enzyme